MARMLVILMTLCAAAVFAGCSSTPPARASELPDDFSLGITVLTPSGMEPAWYIVEPDGTLRAAIGERLPRSPRPPAVRTLSRAQVRHIWEVATKAGLTEHANFTNRVSPTAATEPNAGAIVDLAAMGRRSTAAIPPGEPSQRVGVVVTELRTLAWADR